MITLEGALKALQAAGVLTKIIMAGSLLLVALSAYGIWHHKVYRSGYDRALADIAAEDKRAIGSAMEMRGVWLECRKRGGRWIQTEGRCAP